MTAYNSDYSLVDAADSILIVIDAQRFFYDKLPKQTAADLISNTCWLIKIATYLDIPLLVTAEEHDTQPVATAVEATLPAGTKIYDKVSFGLAGQADILSAVAATERKSAILVGLETDVCVMHSALGLLERDYRVVIIEDAVGTSEPNQQVALARLRSAGAIITNTKGMFYEWMRTVEASSQFHIDNPEMRGEASVIL